MKKIKQEWCERFLIALFTKHHIFPGPNAWIEASCFWEEMKTSGLMEDFKFEGPMAEAVLDLLEIESICAEDGSYMIDVISLKNPFIPTR